MSDVSSNSPAAESSRGEQDATTSDVKHSNPVANKDNGLPSNGDRVQAQVPNRTEAELIEEMKNFDNLLKMLSVYRDNPDLRGNPNDRHIEEIAKVLSNFIDDDPDNFLKSSDDEDEKEREEETKTDTTCSADKN